VTGVQTCALPISFLFDLDDTEKDIIDELKEIFSSRELQIKYKYGTDYDFE
jgi:hypothetical protein